MTEDKLIARAKAETLREVAEVLAGEARLYGNTHHGDIINNTAIGFRSRAAALDASGGPGVAESGQTAREIAGERENAPQPAREGGVSVTNNSEQPEHWKPTEYRVVLTGVTMPPGYWKPMGEKYEFRPLPDGTYRNGIRQDGEWEDAPTPAQIEHLPTILRKLLNHPALQRSDSHALPGALKAAADEIERLRNGTRTDGVTLTREEVEELIEMLADNGYGRAVRKLRARAQLGEKP